MKLTEYDDQTVIRLAQKGNKHAFGVLVKRYMQRAYYVALGFVGSHDDALDLSQEAFVRAYRAIKRFETGRQFFTWYYQILRNLCFNFNRDRKKNVYRFSEMPEQEVLQLKSTDSLRPDVILEKKQVADRLWQAINELPANEKEIIVLREFQGFSYQELADLLSIPIGTVMSRLYHARKHLAKALQGDL
ncbi:MAG TPA: sigma-70 family RNA polymerase sigma factor [Bacteroidetes bacterium]|nr:sigma-70 family RNA polymerase sigma factor [Bacteroidota bacterium]